MTTGHISPEQSARLNDRTTTLLRVLSGDPPPLVMDALLSAFATASVGFGTAKQDAHTLRLVAGILEANSTREAIQQAIENTPAAVLKVPTPDTPPGPPPRGYSDNDIARIKVLVRSVLDLLEGDKGHVGLSVLITCFCQVADHLGESGKAGAVLLETGARMAAAGDRATSAPGAPVAATSSKLH